MQQRRTDYAPITTRIISSILDSLLNNNLPLILIAYMAVTQASSFEDFVVKAILYFVAGLGLVMLPLHYLYFACLERWGATPGKLISGTQIINESGTFISKKDALMREWAYKSLSFVPFGMGLLAARKHPKMQGWHDEMAGTYVVVKNNRSLVAGAILISLFILLIVSAVKVYSIGVARGLF